MFRKVLISIFLVVSLCGSVVTPDASAQGMYSHDDYSSTGPGIDFNKFKVEMGYETPTADQQIKTNWFSNLISGFKDFGSTLVEGIGRTWDFALNAIKTSFDSIKSIFIKEKEVSVELGSNLNIDFENEQTESVKSISEVTIENGDNEVLVHPVGETSIESTTEVANDDGDVSPRVEGTANVELPVHRDVSEVEVDTKFVLNNQEQEKVVEVKPVDAFQHLRIASVPLESKVAEVKAVKQPDVVRLNQLPNQLVVLLDNKIQPKPLKPVVRYNKADIYTNGIGNLELAKVKIDSLNGARVMYIVDMQTKDSYYAYDGIGVSGDFSIKNFAANIGLAGTGLDVEAKTPITEAHVGSLKIGAQVEGGFSPKEVLGGKAEAFYKLYYASNKINLFKIGDHRVSLEYDFAIGVGIKGEMSYKSSKGGRLAGGFYAGPGASVAIQWEKDKKKR